MGSVAQSFPSGALQSVPNLQPGGQLGLRLAWWLPACVALVSEVLSADVPLSCWGLVKRQTAELDPGSGRELVLRLAMLVVIMVWKQLTPSQV